MILIFLMTGLIGLTSGAIAGLFTTTIAIQAALLVPSMVLGTWLGSTLFNRSAEAVFRKAAFVALGLIAMTSLVAAFY
ncbi:hypothetical protein NSU_3385 [Novosphingobium pentaromativorans US6-1]|uniref:Uncharacterized protein n=2 Tax=Novosphingobium pentaromativorans TaxID=205844 RepID=G6EGB4_9SPHN|nr:hypothetical protein NSU_3385 [Novosphingobium pentaromativorans US6-1]